MKTEKLHPESLLRLKLVSQALSDPLVEFRPRAIDSGWSYEGHLPFPVVGFNPLKTTVFYAGHSRLADWMRAPGQSARKHNFRDRLIPEVLGFTHDYLHCWANHAVVNIVPKIRYGTARITRRNIEDMVFCHAVTEIAASVGTDYWFLCDLDINEICDVGTTLIHGYQTSYHERDLPEFRRFNPALRVQDRRFFFEFGDVYLKGYLNGFDLTSAVRSPKVYEWLQHEIAYGGLVRSLTRSWFSFLAPDGVEYGERALAAPLQVDRPWKKRLLHEMCELLWRKVKEGKPSGFSRRMDGRRTWTARHKPIDFRFVNLNVVDAETLTAESFRGAHPDSFRCFLGQLIASLDFAKGEPELLKLYDQLVARQDPRLALAVFREQPRVPRVRGEPYDLFVNP